MRYIIHTEENSVAISMSDDEDAKRKAVALLEGESRELDYTYYDGKFRVRIQVERYLL